MSEQKKNYWKLSNVKNEGNKEKKSKQVILTTKLRSGGKKQRKYREVKPNEVLYFYK